MSPPAARISVAADGPSACIRIAGRANFTSSVDFKALVNELLQRGCRCFVLELSECLIMDSTFLGLLAGLGLKLSGGNEDPSQRGIELLNANERIVELLETLGVLHLFRTRQGSYSPASEAQPVQCATASLSKDEVSRACLEAHRTLMDINPANAARFKDVTQFLAEGLKKIKPD